MSGVLVRESTQTREGFLRSLEHALEDKTYVADRDVVVIENGKITVRITDKETSEGAPVLLADFTFDGMSDEEVRGFMEHYDRLAAKAGAA
jgi:hypothetical protein